MELIEQYTTEFWSHVDIHGEDECWPYRDHKDKDGYGLFNVGSKSWRANRVAFYLANGYWPVFACHTCDNPPCSNPKHLYDGTILDNARDRVLRGRRQGKLVASDVIEIRRLLRESQLTQQQIGNRFGVSKAMVCLIATGKRWSLIQEEGSNVKVIIRTYTMSK